ncbi:MAG: hypothetical protein A3A44_03425 [Candidatus Sungbacteria bacterium RIFCSPLOWO2_01_FULL_60_25]|uniref:Uncharacterized protein n=1 Tax=Candidatus Sungbacteria bacterium RIFCSPLOWO2_01_FULL_60_25 TaxID=1802281 RepID=A0A1G2LCI2_9BACT|nr:MAG: hypothetical protein A3A44_03425 [Candidatus Sungbacteria bacterium RIFCSPLOWO2_01_FULL_60_25]
MRSCAMATDTRRILLTYLSGVGERGTAPADLPGLLGWPASEVNVAVQAALVDGDILRLPRGNVCLAPRLKGQVPTVEPHEAVPNPSAEVSFEQYNVYGQAGAVGHQASAHDNVFNQAWDLRQVAGELAKLRSVLKSEAVTLEQDVAVGAIAEAEVAAKEGNGGRMLAAAKRAGVWALERAQDIGTSVAADVIKKSLGM